MTTQTAPIDVGPLVAAAAEATTFTQTINQLLAFRVTSEEGSRQAAIVIQQLAVQRDAFKQKREEGLKHIRALLRWAEGLFPLAAIKTIDQVIDYLKLQVQQYINDQRAGQAAALTEARSQAEVQQAVYLLAPSVPQGLVEVEHWTWEAVDPTQIPRDYWVLDKERLDDEASKHKAALSIPGIRPKRTTTMRRSRR